MNFDLVRRSGFGVGVANGSIHGYGESGYLTGPWRLSHCFQASQIAGVSFARCRPRRGRYRWHKSEGSLLYLPDRQRGGGGWRVG